MSLSDLASLGTFVSGLAVLASLGFLYLQLRELNAQVRQAERNQQAAIQQATNHQRVENLRDRASNPSLSEALNVCNGRKPNEATMTQWYQAGNHMNALMAIFEDAFYQHRHGLLSDEAFDSRTASLRVAIARPFTRVVWAGTRHAFGSEYVRFVNQLIAQTPTAVADPEERFARWKKEMSSEIAKATA